MATSMNIQALPAYPSTHTRKSLSPSQLATIDQTISTALLHTIALPPAKRDTPAARKFVASYAKDAALQILHGLIWDAPPLSKDDKIIRERTLLLAEKLAHSPSGLGIQDLLDLSIVYASANVSRMKSVFAAALKSDPSLVAPIETDLVPAFTQLFSPAQGLYAIRKASHCVVSFLVSSPSELLRCFAHSKSFVLALASLYDEGLASIAVSYGGLSALRNAESRQADDWELIWVQTKVALVDAFHLIIRTLLNDLSSASGQSLATESERTFDIIFALLELPSSSTNNGSSPSTPYLDRSLLADYQECYSLSQTLASALRHAAEKDARLDLLESSLQSLNSPASSKFKDAGVLKILLRSSGISPGMDNRGDGSRVRSTADGASIGKGKGKAPAASLEPQQPHLPDIDVKVTQVLDILPDCPPEYIRTLFEYTPLGGNPEKVIEALLEGTAPSAEELDSQKKTSINGGGGVVDDLMLFQERRNVFDDEDMDMTRFRVGKKTQDESIIRDRTFIEQMKADILRRAEAVSDEEEEYVGNDVERIRKGIDLAYDDEDGFDEIGKVKIFGDGEAVDEDEDDEDEETPLKPPSPETILELAYLRDPKLFDRDAATRRSKTRSDLKAQTGWGDEQIEGWKIMLERNPRKDKVLAKHEFAGNRKRMVEVGNSEVLSGSGQGRGSHAGRGGRGGRGVDGAGGRGRGRNNARERAWKDKRGNHNRKRGHDKKMARGGAGPPDG